MARSRSCGRCSARASCRAVALDGVADPDPPRRDLPAAAEAPEVGDQTVQLRPAQRCWQSDWTQWNWPMDPRWPSRAASMTTPAIVRAAGRAGPPTGELVWSVMLAGITECGIPSMSLTDNGIVYTGRFHAIESAFEINLRALGMRTINSAPFHPQTCGKIERFWQTLKKWLRAATRPGHPRRTRRTARAVPQFLQPPASPPRTARSHPRRGVHATDKARPADRPLPAPVFVTRHIVGEQSGNLFVPPYRSTSAFAGPATPAIPSATATTSPSSAAHPGPCTSPPTPPATTNPATKHTRTYRTREPKPTP